MRLAWLELRRRPGRFSVALGAIAFLSLLLLFLGALLDGLFLGQTGAIRSQRGDVVVYSAASRDSFLRSTINPELRRIVESTDGVAGVGGLGFTQTTATVPNETEVADVAIVGYELVPRGMPSAVPQDGEAYADERLKGFGVKVGQTLRVGLAGTEVRVIGWIPDTSYQLQGALWTTPKTWRTIAGSVPERFVPDGDFQSLVVQAKRGVSARQLAERIDRQTKGATSSLSKSAAELSLPGIKQQASVFNGIIGTTFVVAVLVVALFFALLTLERIPLYGVLKSMGASSRQLFSGVVLQAVVITMIAFALSAPLMIFLSRNAPPALPIQLTNGRLVSTVIGLTVAAILGSLLSLRRVVRTDPAAAIGA
jgi:putative ABC transport system permease protein